MDLLIAALLFAITIPWSAPELTSAQRTWCEHFARDAQAMTAGSAADAMARMRQSASAARMANLPLVAGYLDRVADQASGGDALTTQRALQTTVHGPVVVIVRFRTSATAESPFDDISLGIRDRDDAAFRELTARLPAIDDTPRGAHAIANLVAHAGSSAQSTAPAAYLPFDPELRATLGRSVIHWKNMTIANWYERDLRPVAEVLNAGPTSGEALSWWYALRFVQGVPGRQSLGDDWAPLAVATQDVVAVLEMESLHKRDLATFLAVTFHTLNNVTRGDAPKQHHAAACLVLNWCIRHGGLTATAPSWHIEPRAMLRSLRGLAKELQEIEAAGDKERGAKLLAEYGALTPDISATIDRLPPPTAPKTEVRFAIEETK
jgi:hypothetical protein